MKARILVIDDDQSMCELVETALSKRGHEVLWRTRGDEGFGLLADRDVDAVLIDVRLKGENGLAICERVVENRPDIPVIVITDVFRFMDAFAALEYPIDVPMTHVVAVCLAHLG